MSCGSGKPKFRLLDTYVGWGTHDPDKPLPSNLVGFDDLSGIRLAPQDPAAVNPADVTGRLLPASLVKGCGAYEWYLLARCCNSIQILRRDACSPDWKSIWKREATEGCGEGSGIALWRGFLAIADHDSNRIEIWTREAGRRIATIAIPAPGPIAFSGKGELLVVTGATKKIARFGLDGRLRGWCKATLHGEPNRLAVDANGRLWVVTISPEKVRELWWADTNDEDFTQGTIDELQAAFPPSGIAAESDAGFCFDQPSASGFEASTCFSWCGDLLAGDKIQNASPPRRRLRGQLLTDAIDSGIPRCRWHRVRLDADVPPGTTVEIAVAALEELPKTDQGDASRDAAWKSFAAGAPHPLDWTIVATSATDALIKQPPGRYLYFRLRFTGNGTATPVVRRVRIDFPRVTSLEHLPEVYRENPQAEDFTERFVSLFDSSLADLDRVIERYPAVLDPAGVPQQLLPWLAGFFDIGLDPAWDEARRRNILKEAPQLYRQRGTLEGLEKAVSAVFDVKPAIEEMAPAGFWGAVGDSGQICHARESTGTSSPSVANTARLGRVRLFGKARVRFRVGRSALGGAPLRSYGNPTLDPFAEGAYRFRVLVPKLPRDSKEERQRLINLIEAQKPAHTVASVRFGGERFQVGITSAVGVDSLFVPLARPKLGAAGNIRLNRGSVLWRGSRSMGGSSIGQTSIVGIHTIAG